MKSYEERLDTFNSSSWPKQEYKSTPQLLAICGFVCDADSSDLGVECAFCSKRLEGWEKDDVPINEHFGHKKTCVLFTTNLLKSRLQLLGQIENSQVLAKKGFVRYDIKKHTPFIFCHKCGSINTNHVCAIKDRYKFTVNSHDFFFVKLIRGDYLETIDSYLSCKIQIPNKYDSLLRAFLENANPFDTFEDTKTVFVQKALQNVEKIIEEDINKLE